MRVSTNADWSIFPPFEKLGLEIANVRPSKPRKSGSYLCGIRTVADQVLQGFTVEVLHGDERLAVLFANVVDGADIGMVEGGRGLSLTPETLKSLAVLGHAFGE